MKGQFADKFRAYFYFFCTGIPEQAYLFMTWAPGYKLWRAGIHLLVWLILFLLPFWMFPRVSSDYRNAINPVLLPLACYAIVFYLNYLLLADKLLFRKKFVLFTLANAVLVVFFLWLSQEFHGPKPVNMPSQDAHRALFTQPLHPPDDKFRFFLLKDLFSFLIPVAFSIAIRSTERWMKAESEKKEIATRNLESELEYLRYQLQPHFFFNALNNIYSLIEISPRRAQDTVHGLSKLMRYFLYETKHKTVMLSREIVFLENYIKLMELRQSEKTQTYYSLPQNLARDYEIAPLLFLPLIENAYKHGVSATQSSILIFNMKVEQDEIIFECRNTNYPKNAADISGSGIGQENLRKRLELLYPGKHELRISTDAENYYTVVLRINLSGT